MSASEEPEEVVAVAFNVRSENVYRYEGPNTTDYPVRFEGVTTEEPLEIENEMRRILSEAVGGTMYFVTDADSEAAEELRGLFGELESDSDLLKTLRERLERLEGECSNG
jgi:hypothetical protein